MTYRARNIAVAVVLAIVAALLTGFYVTSYKQNVQHAEANVSVLVATKDIPQGTSGADVIAKKFLAPQQVLRRSVVPGALSDTKQIEDLIATQPIYAGEQVSARRFQPVTQSGVRSELRGNMRALQMEGDANQLLAGTLRPHDHVDVVANIKYKLIDFRRDSSASSSSASEDLVATRVVLRDLEVLKAPESPGTGSQLNGPGGDFSVLLRVTDTQAQKLFFVQKNGDWTLQLRPVVDAADSPESVETVGSVLTDGLRGNQLAELVLGRRR
ncbi:MAG: Flp pilus assembly protein CpaB [Actinomycetota bacterium]|nr:Flp pilus assembly protein CpaB [Actinomycetota bacterium]